MEHTAKLIAVLGCVAACLAVVHAAAVEAVPNATAKTKLLTKPVAANTTTNTTVPEAGCHNPCWSIVEYYPYKTCEPQCTEEVCERGWGVYKSEEVCCSPGVAFPEGCTQRPKECWVVESEVAKTCVQDQRKCMQGYNVWASKDACCAEGAAFSAGCANITASKEPCWVIDTYYPSRLCKSSKTLCNVAGIQNWTSQAECCKPGGAFEQGCSPPPPVPCFVVGSYYPQRTCKSSDDVATCNRGWGVYTTQDVCCAEGVAFSEGCSVVEPAVVKAGN